MMFPEERDFAIADSVDQIRHVIRAQEKYGVDVIKILATGGVLSKGDSPGSPQFTLEELKAAAETAHMGGRKIAAHAHGTEGIKNAIRAGIDSIEHASLIDDEGIRLAKEHGTYLVMDIYNDDYILNEAPKWGLPTENLDKERMVGRLQRENFRKAVQAGVKMAFGTDAGVYPHGDNARQFFYMVKYGMTPAQAIRAATSSAADLIGRAQDVGTIEAGKYADIIAVNADPLADVRALEHVDFVMKGGVVYKDTRVQHPRSRLNESTCGAGALARRFWGCSCWVLWMRSPRTCLSAQVQVKGGGQEPAPHLPPRTIWRIRRAECLRVESPLDGEFCRLSGSAPGSRLRPPASPLSPFAPAQRVLGHAAADDGGHAFARDRLRARGLYRLRLRRRTCDRRLRRRLHHPRLAKLPGGGRDCLHHFRFDLHPVSRREQGRRSAEDILGHHHGDDRGAGCGSAAGGVFYSGNFTPSFSRVQR